MANRNPNSPLALGPEDLETGMYYTIISECDFVETGRVLKQPKYGEKGWLGAIVLVDGNEDPTHLDLCKAGICSTPDGRWSSTYTVGE